MVPLDLKNQNSPLRESDSKKARRWLSIQLAAGATIAISAGIAFLLLKGRGIFEFLFGYEEKYLFFVQDVLLPGDRHLPEAWATAAAITVWAAQVILTACLSWWMIARIFARKVTFKYGMVAFLSLCVYVPMLILQGWFDEYPQPITDFRNFECFDRRTNTVLVWYYQTASGVIMPFNRRGYYNGTKLIPVTPELCDKIRASAKTALDLVEQNAAIEKSSRELNEQSRLRAEAEEKEKQKKAEAEAEQIRLKAEAEERERRARAETEAAQMRLKADAEHKARLSGAYFGEVKSIKFNGNFRDSRFYKVVLDQNMEDGRFWIYSNGRLLYEVMLTGHLIESTVFIGKSVPVKSDASYHPDDIKLNFFPGTDRLTWYFRDEFAKVEGSGTLIRIAVGVLDNRIERVQDILKEVDRCEDMASRNMRAAYFIVIPFVTLPDDALFEGASYKFGKIHAAIESDLAYRNLMNGTLQLYSGPYSLKVSKVGTGSIVTFLGKPSHGVQVFQINGGLTDSEGEALQYRLGFDVNEKAILDGRISAWASTTDTWVAGGCKAVFVVKYGS